MNDQIQQPVQPQGQVRSAQPAGWYPDPISGAGERYWDGIDWSKDFARDAPSEIERPSPLRYESELECADFMQPSHHGLGGLALGLVFVGLGALVVALKAWSLMGNFLTLERISSGFGPEIAGVFLLLLVILAVYKWASGRV